MAGLVAGLVVVVVEVVAVVVGGWGLGVVVHGPYCQIVFFFLLEVALLCSVSLYCPGSLLLKKGGKPPRGC